MRLRTPRLLRLGGGASRRLPAGITDASLASLATFVTGLVAVNVLDDVARGVYAVFFSAFMLGGVIPAKIRYGPMAVVAVDHPRGERLALLPRSLPMGLLISAGSALVVLPAILVTRAHAGPDLLLPMALTCGATIVLSPTQDYVRRMLHVDGASWAAAAVSAVQLGAAVTLIATFYFAGVPVAWIPFGTLAAANLISVTTGTVLARRRTPSHVPSKTAPGRELWSLGSWLFVGALVTSVSTFLVASITTVLAGPEALGYAEAARIVAQPINVLGVGLSAVLAPRIMETAVARDLRAANRVLGGYSALIVGAAAVYAIVAGAAWWFNPLAVLVPAAYVVPGLVLVAVTANVFGALLYLPTHELTAARRQRTLAALTFAVAPLKLAVAATAGVTDAFARPLAKCVGLLARGIAFGPVRRRHYAGRPSAR